MSEPELFDRLAENPSVHPGKLRKVGARAVIVRFVAGAATSVVAAVLTLVFGPRVGGVMLAFPAILAASLTLIAEEDDREQARQDARGSVAGAAALGGFAILGAVLFDQLPGGVVLVIAGTAWLLVAVALYFVLWWERPGQR
jgi:hypothetical protein